MQVLETYGGEVIFTPGDIVYSSSALIELAPPKIATEKLMTLMEAEGIGFNDLYAALDKFKGHQGPRRRRHHYRQLYLLQHDRRHDQNADHERAVPEKS